jgi:NitT/TauT family transport system ATP-binding protein
MPDDHASPPTALAAPPDPRTVLYANQVEKTYPNGVQALGELRLRIQQGEFVTLLGPSGCGKSTLLAMVAGLEAPSAGHLLWWNRPGLPQPGPGRRLSMVFQDPTLMPWATTAANVRLPLDLAAADRHDSRARVAQALETVGLTGFAGTYPAQLSGGMRMRAAIARALVTDPNLLLMDEPFAALDEFARNRLDAELRRLWRDRDLTVLFVTHSIYEAVFLSTRVVVMAARPGRIIGDLAIDGPAERDDRFRLSPTFLSACATLTELLVQANAPVPTGGVG